MSARDPLIHLMKLVTDDSEVVRYEVARALAGYGPDLPERLAGLRPAPSSEEAELALRLAREYPAQRLARDWVSWREPRSDKARLERGLGLLAAFQSVQSHPDDLTCRLDRLTDSYQLAYPEPDPLTLARFLFNDQGLEGARGDYYNPSNSNLLYVLEHKRGIPISLACIYILTGHRLGLPIEGFNLPGHFLATVRVGPDYRLVDCFSQGKVLDEQSLRLLDPRLTPRALASTENHARSGVILARVLRNLVRAYQQAEDWEASRLMGGLLERTDERD